MMRCNVEYQSLHFSVQQLFGVYKIDFDGSLAFSTIIVDFVLRRLWHFIIFNCGKVITVFGLTMLSFLTFTECLQNETCITFALEHRKTLSKQSNKQFQNTQYCPLPVFTHAFNHSEFLMDLSMVPVAHSKFHSSLCAHYCSVENKCFYRNQE